MCKGKKKTQVIFPSFEKTYGVIAVNPVLYEQVQYVKAITLIGGFASPKCQQMIGEFSKGGKVLFHPDAVPVK